MSLVIMNFISHKSIIYKYHRHQQFHALSYATQAKRVHLQTYTDVQSCPDMADLQESRLLVLSKFPAWCHDSQPPLPL